MSQAPIVIPNTGTLSGLDLVNNTNAALATLDSAWLGTVAPTHSNGRRWFDSSVSNRLIEKISDGTDWLLTGLVLDTSANLSYRRIGGGRNNIASASTCDLGSMNESGLTITGTTTITSFGSSAQQGEVKVVTLGGSLQLTYNATSLILPGGANISGLAGDTFIAECLGSGNWRVISYNAAAPVSSQTVLLSHIAGFTPGISNTGATTAAITISAGQAADSSGAAYISKATTTAWAVSNGNAINGYQGGTTLPNSSTIHFFMCYGGSGVGSFASTSLTPTLPAGYNTYYRRIFSCRTTVAGALIPYVPVEMGGGAIKCYLTTEVMDFNGNSTTTAALLALTSIPVGVKMLAKIRAIATTAAYNGILISSPDATDVAPSISGSGGYNGTAPGFDLASTSVASGIMNLTKEIVTDTSAQVRHRATATTALQVVTSEFTDFRR